MSKNDLKAERARLQGKLEKLLDNPKALQEGTKQNEKAVEMATQIAAINKQLAPQKSRMTSQERKDKKFLKDVQEVLDTDKDKSKFEITGKQGA